MMWPSSVRTEFDGIVTTAPQLPLQENKEEGGVQPHSGQVKATSYEAAQFRTADCLRQIRELVTQLDDMHTGANHKECFELSQQIRRVEGQAKLEMQTAKKLALVERRQHEFELLSRHFKSTINLVRDRYGGGLPAVKLDDKNVQNTSVPFTGFKNSLEESTVFSERGDITSSHPSHGYNIRDDKEFIQFFQSTQKNDMMIDEALDRIYTGVQRLNENAIQITSELQVQEQMLEETEQKVDYVHGKLGKLNIKIREAIRKMDRPMMAVYAVCCLILMAIITVIYFMVKS
ncbi:syntaxin [Trypanosoma theileri]|uniref:Syntaxin n=1 Tax=Trypanosoma theileri TaxID=67003 RepID=A0A1X0NYH7_9TRYP|nr:syntaxin [Trypanosoma theileri]ORC89598.1 syntaxin [Trypanosoma theileri]